MGVVLTAGGEGLGLGWWCEVVKWNTELKAQLRLSKRRVPDLDQKAC